ncbi:MAG: 2OG-Fe(II) oxygenase [Nitrospiraceae bacterium]
MKVSLQHFDPSRFSFHNDPILVIEDFWTTDERRHFLEAMRARTWRSLEEMPHVRTAFPNCGNWAKADMGQSEVGRFLDRLSISCIHEYLESFPNVTGRGMSFHYYSYGVGDCLLTHDDSVQAYPSPETSPTPSSLRRLALITYLHDDWQADWGGELILYTTRSQPGSDRPRLTISHCIAPEPGSLVLFTVPRFHRVCRVDPMSGDHRRLSIAGWLMTEHAFALDETHPAA